MDQAWGFTLPSVGVVEGVVGASQLVEAHPGRKRELRPEPVRAYIELEVVALVHKFRGEGAWPATLRHAEDARQVGVVREVQQRDQGRFYLERAEGGLSPCALPPGESRGELGHFVGLDEGGRAEFPRSADAVVHRQGLPRAQALFGLGARGLGDDLALKHVDFGVARLGHVDSKAGPQIHGVAVGREHGEALGTRGNVCGDFSTQDPERVRGFEAHVRGGFHHYPRAFGCQKLDDARLKPYLRGTQGGALARPVACGARYHRVGAAERVNRPGAERKQGQACGQSTPPRKTRPAQETRLEVKRGRCGFRVFFGKPARTRKRLVEVEILQKVEAVLRVLLEGALQQSGGLGGGRSLAVFLQPLFSQWVTHCSVFRESSRWVHSASSRRIRCSFL